MKDEVLSLVIGAVVMDTLTIAMNYGRFIFVSDELTRWYKEFRISAMIMDCIIGIFYVLIGIRLAERNGVYSQSGKIAYMVGVQLVGDMFFYVLFNSVPRGTYVFDLFKDYKEEVGYHALWADSLLTIGTYWVGLVLLKDVTYDDKILTLLASVYVSQYILYLK